MSASFIRLTSPEESDHDWSSFVQSEQIGGLKVQLDRTKVASEVDCGSITISFFKLDDSMHDILNEPAQTVSNQ